MPSAITVPIREQILSLKEQGKTYSQVGEALGLSRHTVRGICRRGQKEGKDALKPSYEHCGKRESQFERLVWRSAIFLKRRYPTWGGGIIRVVLKKRWPERIMPTERTFQRWFLKAGLASTPAPPNPQIYRARAKEVHQCWQVDAVSHQTLANGTEACWLSATDEASRAIVAASAFPLKAI
jgi:hypothetical protein